MTTPSSPLAAARPDPAAGPDPGAQPFDVSAYFDAELVPGVTRRAATVAAMHAVHVQGGASDPEREALRLALDMAHQDDPAAWLATTIEQFRAELADKGFLGYVDLEPPPPTEAPPADGLPLDLVRRYKRIRELQAAADTEAKTLKTEADALEAQLVDLFVEHGMQNLSLDGKTVYLHRSTFAQRKAGATAEDVKDALRAAGQGDLVTETVNAQTLSAYVRDILDSDEGGQLPDPLDEVLELGERYSIRINAAGSRAKSKTHSK